MYTICVQNEHSSSVGSGRLGARALGRVWLDAGDECKKRCVFSLIGYRDNLINNGERFSVRSIVQSSRGRLLGRCCKLVGVTSKI